ncbi:winged helix-turn-helix domain-containing protein [Micromonospora sagamiensis]|uniref:winged helix-turn-helix domain-containing protein n=1 Tax=Micromonospora sagamiensis TaxID=47875 RepID=UPI001E3B7BF9|nr:winged helix-turn-helix domain-containing protein [Micromonospora sagamiensis]
MNDLRVKIERGLLKPGDKLPTTKELADEYQTSVGTARKAVEILLEAGVVEGRQGLGVFVPDE